MTIEVSETYCGALRLPIFLHEGTGQLLESRQMVTLAFGESLEPTLVYRKGTIPALKDGLSLLALFMTSKHLHSSCYLLSNYPMSH